MINIAFFARILFFILFTFLRIWRRYDVVMNAIRSYFSFFLNAVGSTVLVNIFFFLFVLNSVQVFFSLNRFRLRGWFITFENKIWMSWLIGIVAADFRLFKGNIIFHVLEWNKNKIILILGSECVCTICVY